MEQRFRHGEHGICEGSKQGENPGSAEYLRVGGVVEEEVER